MTVSVDEVLDAGRRVRERRQALGLSVRQLAERANLSPSYISAIEVGKNPSTGRPTVPSRRVLESLSKALGLTLAGFGGTHSDAPASHAVHDHTLIYTLGNRRGDALPVARRLYGESVSHWICICDPRNTTPMFPDDAVSEPDVTRITWPFGSSVYPDEFLVPDRIPQGLAQELEINRNALSDEDVGVIIEDCSAVMRWMVNPESEVEYETVWPEKVCRCFHDALGTEPAANICVYNHADIEPLSHRIDVLNTILDLIQTHESLVCVDTDDRLEVGNRAATRILSEVRPAGVSVNAWHALATASAQSLTGPQKFSPTAD